MSLEGAKGRLKNARNQLDAIRTASVKGKDVDIESVEYALEEVNAAIDKIEDELDG